MPGSWPGSRHPERSLCAQNHSLDIRASCPVGKKLASTDAVPSQSYQANCKIALTALTRPHRPHHSPCLTQPASPQTSTHQAGKQAHGSSRLPFHPQTIAHVCAQAGRSHTRPANTCLITLPQLARRHASKPPSTPTTSAGAKASSPGCSACHAPPARTPVESQSERARRLLGALPRPRTRLPAPGLPSGTAQARERRAVHPHNKRKRQGEQPGGCGARARGRRARAPQHGRAPRACADRAQQRRPAQR